MPVSAKSTSIKGVKRKSGSCAWKVIELTSRDLSSVRSDVGKASEALQRRKAEQQIGQAETWSFPD
jgi:hypothetical protein